MLVLAAVATPGMASQPVQGGIYTCVDAAGRRWTADRPIAQCMDREQRVLSSSGLERQRIAPALTEAEMAQRLEERRVQQSQAQRLLEQRRRDAALLSRYPNQASHEAQRQQSLVQFDELQLSAEKRLVELKARHAEQVKELDFYANDPGRIPARLKASIEAAQRTEEEQQRFIERQIIEKQRVQRRFDAELERLRPLWDSQNASVSTTAR